MNNQNVVVRFAPSPTGPLHIGGVRTALFNYLFAKRHGGKFLLRIEDTDQGRFVPGAEQYIQEALAWCGIEPDESPWRGGPHAPYRQSERKPMYAQYAMQLLQSGNAYYAFDTPEELDAIRQKVEKEENGQFQYNAATRMKLKNSLTLSEEEIQKRIASGEHYVIRFKMPAKEEVKFYDLIREEVNVFTFTLDDKVLLKSDGMPTYHLANVVDDHLMGITHVIRGEEWLPSAPLHVLMYRAFGWEDTMPKFCHLPLLLKPDGHGKLSKRDGDKMGFAVFPLEWKDPFTGAISRGYREDGYLPDAFINFLVLLGWNPGTDQEIFSLEELSSIFSMEKIGKSGTKFDIEKAKWFNQQYLKKKDQNLLAQQVRSQLKQRGIEVSDAKALKIVQLLQDRVTFTYELWDSTPYIYSKPTSYDESVTKKKWSAEAASAFTAFAERLGQTQGEPTAEGVKTILNDVLTEKGIALGKVMQVLRVAITGVGSGPDLMLMMEILGKEEVVQRIKNAVTEFNKA